MGELKSTHKVGLVGVGMVGAAFAYSLMERGIANELVLIDRDAARAENEEPGAFPAPARTLEERYDQVKVL